MREGSALLQGIVTCGHCGRGLFTYYRGDKATPGYRCSANDLGDGGGHYCFQVGAVGVDKAVADAFLEAITPAAVEASLLAWEQLEADRDAALRQWRLEVERARYEAERAERRYRIVEPEHRLVTRGLEAEWENRLRDLAAAENELAANSITRVVPVRVRSSAFARWVWIFAKSGLRPRPRIATAKNCCALCWRKSSSR